MDVGYTYASFYNLVFVAWHPELADGGGSAWPEVVTKSFFNPFPVYINFLSIH